MENQTPGVNSQSPEPAVPTNDQVTVVENLPKPKNFLTILLSVLLLLSLVVAGFFAFQSQNLAKELAVLRITQAPVVVATSEPPVYSELTAEQDTTLDLTINWKTYTNTDLGISFSYPAHYGDFKITFSDGETGQSFVGGNEYFTVGGISEDYTAGRSGDFYAFVKYLNKSGKYYHVTALEKEYLIEPTKIIDVNNQKVLVVNGNSYVDERGIEGPVLNPGASGGALINLTKNKIFKGLAIRNLNINILPQIEFEKILSTFKFTN